MQIMTLEKPVKLTGFSNDVKNYLCGLIYSVCNIL